MCVSIVQTIQKKYFRDPTQHLNGGATSRKKLVAMTTFAGYEDVLNGVEIPDHQLCFDDKKYGGVARKIYHRIHYSVKKEREK